MATKAAKPPAQPKNISDPVSVQISLPQMLDLALGTPELMLDVPSDGPSLQLHEYNIIDGTEKAKRRTSPKENIASAEVLTDGAVSAGGKVNTENGVRTTKGTKQEVGAGSDVDAQKVIFVEPIVDGATPTALGFKQLDESVKELQRRFQALEELQNNPELMERLKGKIKDPLTDMWQIININKRLDANEQGIDKLMTMVQDLARSGISDLPTETDAGEKSPAAKHISSTDVEQFDQRIKDIENTMKSMEQTISNLHSIIEGDASDFSPTDKIGDNRTTADQAEASGNDKPEIENENVEIVGRPGDNETETTAEEDLITDEDSVQKSQTAKDNASVTSKATVSKPKLAAKADKTPVGKSDVSKPAVTKAESGKRPITVAGEVDVVNMYGDVTALKTEIAQLRTDVYDLNTKVEEISSGKKIDVKTSEDSEHLPDRKEVTESATREMDDKQFWEAIQNIEKTHGEALNGISDRVSELEKEMTILVEKTEAGPVVDLDEDGSLTELLAKIQNIQADVEKFNKIADRLIDDKEDRETHMKALYEQIEFLKTIKADKEDLEDALADKADALIVNRKVSHDQFAAACDDLARGLEEAIVKLSRQESIWQQALDEVQREVEGKVDKIEMTPLKEFVSDRVKTLQEKMRKVAEMQAETEAAGTKKILRDVQCLSCDKNVVMKTEDVGRHRAEPLPCTVSMKPYLTYELDQVRRQQRRLPHGKNMLAFEAALLEDAKRSRPARNEASVKTPRNHLCNRYCGGSHTVTTPQQRVMRMGHFLSQWGPEVIQLTDGTVKRTDEKAHQTRTMLDVCGPCYDASETARTEPAKLISAPPNGSAQRKSQQSKRSNGTPRRRSSRKASGESAARKELDSPSSVLRMEEVAKDVEDVLPIDPTAHEDRIIRDVDDINEEEMEHEAA